MSIAVSIILFVVGLIMLFLGGEGLVRGASRLARVLGISPIVIGLTVVAFGTSAPEFVVGLIAALKGASDVVLGNIIGSNISNIGLI
ncbi:MAG: sodium:calcium antiporter, partial [Thermodesulfobacteriota bacterium]